MALKRAELMEICAELCRFIMFTGLFFWLLTNGPDFAGTTYYIRCGSLGEKPLDLGIYLSSADN